MQVEPLTLMLDGAVPIPAGALVAYLAARPREAQAFVADLADAMIQEQDTWDDADYEDGGDVEPNFAGFDPQMHFDECEPCCEDEGACIQSVPHDEEPDLERDGSEEPSLGSLDGQICQQRWAGGDTSDLEWVNEDGSDGAPDARLLPLLEESRP